MKKATVFIALTLFLLQSLPLFGQEKTPVLTRGADKSYSYQNVFDVAGKSKDDLFALLKDWVIKNVKTQSNTNYFDEQGKNAISTTITFPVIYNSSLEVKINIEVKDAKYRLTANSFIWYSKTGTAKNLGDWDGINNGRNAQNKIIEDVDEKFSKIVSSILSAVKDGNSW